MILTIVLSYASQVSFILDILLVICTSFVCRSVLVLDKSLMGEKFQWVKNTTKRQ